jgi:hypothetical protein
MGALHTLPYPKNDLFFDAGFLNILNAAVL